MDLDLSTIILSLLVAAGGVAAGYVFLKPKAKSFDDIQKKTEHDLEKAQHEAQQILQETTLKISHLKKSGQTEKQRLEDQFKRIESLINSKDEQLKKREEKNNEFKKIVDEEMALVDALKDRNKNIDLEFTKKLATQAAIQVDEAKAIILQNLSRDLELMQAERLKKHEDYLNEEKERLAKNLLTSSIQRYAAPTSVEKMDTHIAVERDENKGRITGRDGQVLMILEELTGVDIIFNDEPNTIIVSCYDLVRREITKILIEKLLRDRNITMEKIRALHEDAKRDMEKKLIRIGRDTIKNLELDNRKFPDEFAIIVGRLQFRTSYGQNILRHSFEVGYFTLMLGAELGLDMDTSKVAGFFHDLGKAIDQEVGGSHDFLTKEIMEKFQFPELEIHAAWAHHDAEPQRTPEAMIVKAGDAISAGRPGARQETLEKYIERVQAIESISKSYEGVSKAYTISGGREVRIMVEPQTLNDLDLPDLAKNVAVEIQNNVAYPGKIRVNVIRRTMASDYAKMAGAAGILPTKKKFSPKKPTKDQNEQ